RINTARGRQKDKNLARDRRITILSVSPDDPYHWIDVRGVAEVITEDGAIDHINKLAYKYNGTSYYGDMPLDEIKKRETRVTIKIRPHKVVTSSK
ncbi:MAG: PPOX class F420-dependent oxidoreductase, partial [Anaerolineae bacterium]|nr:PPOX class F420-dependent oxidoreductase [Anaerolineae bacterium]